MFQLEEFEFPIEDEYEGEDDLIVYLRFKNGLTNAKKREVTEVLWMWYDEVLDLGLVQYIQITRWQGPNRLMRRIFMDVGGFDEKLIPYIKSLLDSLHLNAPLESVKIAQN